MVSVELAYRLTAFEVLASDSSARVTEMLPSSKSTTTAVERMLVPSMAAKLYRNLSRLGTEIPKDRR